MHTWQKKTEKEEGRAHRSPAERVVAVYLAHSAGVGKHASRRHAGRDAHA